VQTFVVTVVVRLVSRQSIVQRIAHTVVMDFVKHLAMKMCSLVKWIVEPVVITFVNEPLKIQWFVLKIVELVAIMFVM